MRAMRLGLGMLFWLSLQASPLCATPMPPGSAYKPRKPHIFFLLVDDWGYSAVGFRNKETYTPNIDRLRHEGLLLERHYADRYVAARHSRLIADGVADTRPTFRAGFAAPRARASFQVACLHT